MPEEKQTTMDQQLQADVPSYYANSVAVGISPYDLSMVFGLNIPNQVKSQARVVMSLEHAVVMVMVLRRVLREHVKRTGITPTVPGEVMRDLQLDEEEPLW
jgi:hypothetical protein